MGSIQLNWYSSLYIEPDYNKLPNNFRKVLTGLISELLIDIDKYLHKGIVLQHKWNEKDLVLFDNQLLLHGRTIIKGTNKRLLYRIWFDSASFLS